MTQAASAAAKTPWHLWVVGILSGLWNAYGCYDYYMSMTGGDAYFRSLGMTDAQIAFYNAMPSWLAAAWAIGVWGALAGSILLLMRSKWALHAFIASFAGFLVSVIYTYGVANGVEANGTTALIMSAVIAAACLFFIWYAHFATKRGILR